MKIFNGSRRRLGIQLLFAALFNGYAVGFAKGQIFTGASKGICVPVLNCYSCPGALGACPLGAMQAVAGGYKHNFSFYAVGSVMLFGVLLGRLICGFLCPFGLVQDLLQRLPVPKIRVPKGIDGALRYLKYVVLVVFVLAMPVFVTNAFGLGAPAFCKWICPAGTLGGALPLLSTNASLRATVGALFGWKLGVLVAIVILSTLIQRPFCKYLCPLGAIYGLCNRVSFYQQRVDHTVCVGCGACERACPMQIDVRRAPNSAECIRCGACRDACRAHAISAGVDIRLLAREAAAEK
ncbi:MAG: 4Fe-4S binding protein [Peptococcaceae bacterium]|nr:4Fe-4S binding protein [Peptococcaceae bacterium]